MKSTTTKTLIVFSAPLLIVGMVIALMPYFY
jgi:hypothetical protein